jgi:hypothetical protein
VRVDVESDSEWRDEGRGWAARRGGGGVEEEGGGGATVGGGLQAVARGGSGLALTVTVTSRVEIMVWDFGGGFVASDLEEVRARGGGQRRTDSRLAGRRWHRLSHERRAGAELTGVKEATWSREEE